MLHDREACFSTLSWGHQGLKPSVASDAKKLKRWCQVVRARVYPTAAALVSSEALTVMMLPARSSQNVERKDLDTDSESDAEEETYVLENDLETTGEQSNTVEETGNTNSTDTVPGRTEAPTKDDKGKYTEGYVQHTI
jgi:hypothetical protein